MRDLELRRGKILFSGWFHKQRSGIEKVGKDLRFSDPKKRNPFMRIKSPEKIFHMFVYFHQEKKTLNL